MKMNLPLIAAALILTAPAARAGEGPSPDEIVKRADEVRNPQEDYTVDVAVTDEKSGGSKQETSYQVLTKGHDKTVVKTLAPEINRGRTLLMRGRDMWAFLPDASQPVRIGLQQRLTGEVANGDLARTNFAGDYAAKTLKKDPKYHVLELTATHDDLTYNRIVYWVEKDSYRPFKAEFYALSGRLLKECRYEGYKELGGRTRPTRIVFTDAVTKGHVSTLRYDSLKVATVPDKLFSKDYLKKLKY